MKMNLEEKLAHCRDRTFPEIARELDGIKVYDIN